jgi:probable rRNA maturation factor
MVEVNNLTKQKIDKEFLKGLAKKVLKRENKTIDISIVIVGKKRIRDLNKKYREKDQATDVLSFGEGLNEIVICPEMAKSNLNEVLIHGILHLLGYEHSKKMEEKEKLWQNHTL